MKSYIKNIILALLLMFLICSAHAGFSKDFGEYNHHEETLKQNLIKTLEKEYGPCIYAHTNQTSFLTIEDFEQTRENKKVNFVDMTTVNQITNNTLIMVRFRAPNGHYYSYTTDIETYLKCLNVKDLVKALALFPHWAQYVELDVVVIPKGSYIQGFYGTVNKQERPTLKEDALDCFSRVFIEWYMDRPGGGQQLYICSCENVSVYKVGYICDEMYYKISVKIGQVDTVWPIPPYYLTALAYKFPKLNEAIQHYLEAIHKEEGENLLISSPKLKNMHTSCAFQKSLLIQPMVAPLILKQLKGIHLPLSSYVLRTIRSFLKIGFKKFY